MGLLLAGLAVAGTAALPPARRTATRLIHDAARWLGTLEGQRLARFLGGESSPPASGRRALEYLAVRWPVGLLGGFVLVLLGYGAAVGSALVGGWLVGRRPDNIPPTWPIVLYILVLGLVLLYLALQGLAGVAALDRRLARHFLGPSERERLQRRIAELASSRAGIVEAVDAERRRIERDLHDGVQQRLVALAMLLGRTRRSDDPAKSHDLLRQAHEESQHILNDLRDVAWRVYPTALDTLGLEEALAAVADRSSVPVQMSYTVAEPLAAPIATAVYFVVCEGVTNAAKHSGADLISVIVDRRERIIHVRISDNGAGGADPGGGGLSGLARRVVALDGTLAVESPRGGPTTITAELPCA